MSRTMKIMTLNLNFCESKHGRWPVRRELIAQAIRQHGPDIIAFQAVRKDPGSEDGKDQAAQLADRLPEFKHVVFIAAAQHADGRQDGSALLSRFPLEKVEHHVLSMGIEPPHEAEDPARRIILCARLTSPPIAIFNSHYSWVSIQAASNLQEALAYMRQIGGAALLVGDLNTVSESDLMRRLAADGWTDVWAYLRPQDAGYTFESNAPDKRIDYVWARQELLSSLREIDVVKEKPNADGARLSDHLGLVVTLA
jgi:endonuclease/exonuclease/phosphatase family metal-dependent hydrolase